MVKLRPYQAEAVGATLEAWGTSDRPGALLMATGLGKTVVFAELARISHALGHRTLVLVHRDELVRQTVAKLHQADPALRVGIVQGPNMGIYADVVVASVQTIVRRLSRIRRDQFPRIVVDECHHLLAASYMKIVGHFGAYDGGATRMVGVTATLERAGRNQGFGDALPGGVWFERGIRWGVDEGFLVPAEVRTVALGGLDTDTVGRGADGDLAAGQLGKAMSTIAAGKHIAAAYTHYGQNPMGGLRRAISFAPTIDVAVAWAGDYEAAGARTAVITGATPPHERQAAYADVAAGRKDVLSSVMVLTEGFDLPAVEVAIIGRPTKSMPLLTQMVGRVLRPAPGTGKHSALLLDVVGALGGGLARSCDLSIPGPEKPEAPEQDPDQLPPSRRDVIVIAPPKTVEWVARDLLTGQPIKPRKPRKGMVEPVWLRTAGGVPFLPQTPEYPWRIFCWVREDSPSPWWRLPRGGGSPEPIEIPGAMDPRVLHPGLPEAWESLPPTGPQADTLRKLALPAVTSKAAASAALEAYFASRDLDRLCRPKLAVTDPPGVARALDGGTWEHQ